MSSPRTATGPASAKPDEKRAAPVPASEIDSGEPITDLPPMIEPMLVGFEEIAEPAPRRPPERVPRPRPPPRSTGRSFLAPVMPPTGARSPIAPASAGSSPISPLPLDAEGLGGGDRAVGTPLDDRAAASPPPRRSPIEGEGVDPAIAIAPPPATVDAVAKPAPEVEKTPAFWARAWPVMRGRLPAKRSSWLKVVGIVAGAVVLLVLLGRFAGIGPFTPAQRYPVLAAPHDPAQRLAYFQAGARAGDRDAELQLAILYAKGDGVTQDYGTAATWFRAAANQGVTRAQYDLGVLYERGRGVAVDQTEAANWYLKAAQAGHPLAEYNLAVCYAKGQGIRQSLSEAALWYRRAATQGVVQAMINLGMAYEKGEGMAASPVDAYAWYLAAGRRGSQPAARRAEDLYAGLQHLDQIRAEALASDVAGSIHDPADPDRDAAGAAGH